MPPLLPFEVEPGIAINELTHLAHPFTVPAKLRRPCQGDLFCS